jgi:ribose 5-phosphate isomerase A
VAREIVRAAGSRYGATATSPDNGNWILDVHNWRIADPVALEADLNQITGVVCVGLVREAAGGCRVDRRKRCREAKDD